MLRTEASGIRRTRAVDVCDEGEVIFDASEASEYACERFINISLPNLAFPYRRTIQVDVVRDDTSRSVTASTTRQLVVTGTKARGGGGFSSDVFWATVPLDDMVYTVLHDPPGGLSHSELSSGTELTLTYTLAKTRVASAGGSFDSISTGAQEAKVGAMHVDNRRAGASSAHTRRAQRLRRAFDPLIASYRITQTFRR